MKLRVLDIVPGTSVDGPGLRTSIYVAGCAHNCAGCHNPQTWDFNGGNEMDVEAVMEVILENGFNVTLSGGDPIYQIAPTIELARLSKEQGLNVWLYTGFTFEQLDIMPEAKQLLEYVDVVVDGPYIESLRDITLHFRGSSNQRLIDVAKSRYEGSVVLFKPEV